MAKIKLMRVDKLFFNTFLLKSLLAVLATFFAGFFLLTHEVKAEGGEPSILLEPSFKQMGMKEEFEVAVVINSDLPLVGADVRISYDDRVLEVVSIDEGEAFKNLPLKNAGKGSIALTGLAEKGGGFSGTEVLATIKFKAKDAGDTNLIISFNPGETSDSNLTQVPVADVLTKTEVGHYVIGTPLQRSGGAAKRFLIKIFPYLIFLAFLAVAGYLAYRWYKQQKAAGPEVFIPEEVPLDQPPPVQGTVIRNQ